MLLGGRGCGKTRAGAEYVLKWLNEHGRRARVGVGAPTLGDARDVCAEGESGLITIGGDQFVHYNRHLLEARHYKGGFVKFLGSERPARWNGPQWNLLWADELALWNEESWVQAQFGVRLKPNPHIIVTTTPKNRRFVRELAEHSRTRVSKGQTLDNPDRADTAVQRLYAEYGGTRLGIQELMGEFIDDVEGALWRREWIDDYRVHDFPELERIVVAIDPASTASNTSDYTAICVAGVSKNRHFYVLKAEQYKVSPADWAKTAIRDYDDNQADEIVVEANFGKDLVLHTLRNVIGNTEIIPKIQTIHHKRGKVIRADPVAALYEQGRCLAQGTLVTTEYGDIPIEQVSVGDRVLTRKGFRRVLWSGQTGIRETVEVRTGDGKALVCTPDHPIWVNGRGFVHAEQVVPNCDTLATWEPSTPALTAGRRSPESLRRGAGLVLRSTVGQPAASQYDRTLNTKVCGTTSSEMGIFGQVGMRATSYSTVPSGETCTAKSRTGGMSTILTETPQITPQKTSSHYHQRATGQDTLARTTRMLGRESLPRRSSGGKSGNRETWCAKNAENPSQQRLPECGSAPLPVIRAIGIESVRKNVALPVYDLTVEGEPEFFANGVLVHNCHHVGLFNDAENQMCTFPIENEHDDLVDAITMAITHLGGLRRRFTSF